jgi:hypothetical protein
LVTLTGGDPDLQGALFRRVHLDAGYLELVLPEIPETGAMSQKVESKLICRKIPCELSSTRVSFSGIVYWGGDIVYPHLILAHM